MNLVVAVKYSGQKTKIFETWEEAMIAIEADHAAFDRAGNEMPMFSVQELWADEARDAEKKMP